LRVVGAPSFGALQTRRVAPVIIAFARRPAFFHAGGTLRGEWMLQLNQVILVDNPSVVLKEEGGIFELVSPLGDVIQVSCKPGLEMGLPENVAFDPARKRSDNLWAIRKIAELPAADEPQPESL
jgi:hypothetical protein